MKIFIEKFDPSAPSWIRSFLSDNVGRFRKTSRARGIDDFAASSAEFTDVSNESTSELRRRIKSGDDVLFLRFPGHIPEADGVLMVTYNPESSNKLRIIGNSYANYSKDDSFKSLVSKASDIYYTNVTTEVPKLRANRRLNRAGLVSRRGDSAQNSDFHWFDDPEDQLIDASGYVYDAKRLVKKLMKMNADNPAKLLQKSISTFEKMVDNYSDTIKTLSRKRPYDTETFSVTGFSYIIREGERVISEAAMKMNEITEYVDRLAEDMESVNSRRSEKGSSELSEEEFIEAQDHLKGELNKDYSDMVSYARRLNRILDGKDR